MNNIPFWLIGCIGITLIITTGKIFAPLRVYLKGFSVQYNPLRVLGELLSCSMCSGFWVGFIWSFFAYDVGFLEGVLWGGLDQTLRISRPLA